MLSAAVLLAAFAGIVGALAIAILVQSATKTVFAFSAPLVRSTGFTERVLRPLRRARIEGAPPTDKERLQLGLTAAITGFVLERHLWDWWWASRSRCLARGWHRVRSSGIGGATSGGWIRGLRPPPSHWRTHWPQAIPSGSP